MSHSFSISWTPTHSTHFHLSFTPITPAVHVSQDHQRYLCSDKRDIFQSSSKLTSHQHSCLSYRTLSLVFKRSPISATMLFLLYDNSFSFLANLSTLIISKKYWDTSKFIPKLSSFSLCYFPRDSYLCQRLQCLLYCRIYISLSWFFPGLFSSLYSYSQLVTQ